MNSMSGTLLREEQNDGEHTSQRVQSRGFVQIEESPDLVTVFEQSLPHEVARLRGAHEDFMINPAALSHRDRLYDIAQDLESRAVSFGYDLITVLCRDLCDFLDGRKVPAVRQITVIGFYVSAMERIAQFNITGPGGEKARDFVERLRVLAAG